MPKNLADLLDVIRFDSTDYSLCGAILFEPPLIENGLGHYTAAIKSFQSWTLYDDLKKEPHAITSNKQAVITSLLYVKLDGEVD